MEAVGSSLEGVPVFWLEVVSGSFLFTVDYREDLPLS